MLSHSDRRQGLLAPLRWAKSGPPRAVASGSPSAKHSGSVALLGQATSPPCTPLLAETLLDAIPVVQPNVIWL